MDFPQPRAQGGLMRRPEGARQTRTAAPDEGLSRQSLSMLAMLNAHEGGGGALDLARLAGMTVSRAEAEAALGTSAGSDRLGIDLSEFVPDLPDNHIVLQAVRLGLAARAALKLVAADDAEQAQLAAEYFAQLTDDTAPARQAAIDAHKKAVEQAMRRGVDPPKFERPEPEQPGGRFERPFVIDARHLLRSNLDPMQYLEPPEHGLLSVRERRTTLQAEKRDLERLVAAADARIAATMSEIVGLVEQMYEGIRPGHIPEFVDIGPAWSAACKLAALTTEKYALAVWRRVVASFRRLFED